MIKFRIDKDYYDEGAKIYEKNSLTLEPGLTVLVGCNGSGKTTLLRQIKILCNKDNIPVFSFNNYTDGGKEIMQHHMLFGNVMGVVENYMSSEGERINNAMAIQANKIGNFIRDHMNSKQIFILLDAVDSGLSADNIVELKRNLFDTIIQDCSDKSIEIYIVVAGNSYEMASGENCIDTCKLTKFIPKSYSRWRKVIMESRRKKNIRYGWDDFAYGGN